MERIPASRLACYPVCVRFPFTATLGLIGALGCGSSDGDRRLFQNGSTGGAGGASSSGGASSAGASGSGGASGGGATNTSGAGGSSIGTGGSAGASNTGGASGGNSGSGGACQPTTWCRDQDGDQHGDSTQTQTACVSPGSGWSAVCDDCNDSEKLVHPGAACQAAAYTAAGGVTLSFDYDCDGFEVECGTFARAGTCAPAGVGKCTGSGYLPDPNRTATAGQDAYCGSTAYQNCVAVGVPCVAQATTMTAVVCH